MRAWLLALMVACLVLGIGLHVAIVEIGVLDEWWPREEIGWSGAGGPILGEGRRFDAVYHALGYWLPVVVAGAGFAIGLTARRERRR